MTRKLVTFHNGMDERCRQMRGPCVARFHVTPTDVRYCIIGTQYGYLHTTGGDVRTWGSYSGALQALKRYVPL
jgi:hypothetical protein